MALGGLVIAVLGVLVITVMGMTKALRELVTVVIAVLVIVFDTGGVKKKKEKKSLLVGATRGNAAMNTKNTKMQLTMSRPLNLSRE